MKQIMRQARQRYLKKIADERYKIVDENYKKWLYS